MRAILILLFAAFAALADGRTENGFSPATLTGQTFIHDPSTIVKDGGRYYVFGTGPGIRTKSSPDLIHWESGRPVFREPPSWINHFVPAFGEYSSGRRTSSARTENFSSTTPRPPGR